MRTNILSAGALVLISAFTLLAQHGGKAEPNRIDFAKGASSKVLTGILSTGSEMEYVFAAAAGQKVTIRNATRLFDFKVFSGENFDEGDFDSSPTYTFEVPASGDYNLFIRKKVAGPRRASYRITLTIK